MGTGHEPLPSQTAPPRRGRRPCRGSGAWGRQTPRRGRGRQGWLGAAAWLCLRRATSWKEKTKSWKWLASPLHILCWSTRLVISITLQDQETPSRREAFVNSFQAMQLWWLIWTHATPLCSNHIFSISNFVFNQNWFFVFTMRPYLEPVAQHATFRLVCSFHSYSGSVA